MDEREDWMMTDAEVDYWNLVESDVQTCWGCPTQWEGRLKSGSMFYFRYRHGWASLGIGATVGEAVGDNRVGFEWLPNGMADGVLDDRQYREAFMKLYRQLQMETTL